MFESNITSHEQAVSVMESLAMAALERWPVVVKKIRLIKYRENAVFAVVSDNNRSFALRIHRGDYHTDDELRSELNWMNSLQEFGIDVPVIVPAEDGSLFVSVKVAGLTKPLQVDMFEWIDGHQLGTSEVGLGNDLKNIEGTYRTIGNIAARLHNQATTWAVPKDFVRHAWDLEGLVGEKPFWGRFWELNTLSDEQRELLLEAREIVRREIAALVEGGHAANAYSMIHADFVPENLFVVEGKVRLLDFDDAGFGWHLFELATALYFIQNDPNFETAKTSLIDGYREFRDLSDFMLSKLPVFMMARGFTYLGWVHTRPDSEEGKALSPYVVGLACNFAEGFVRDWR